MKIPHLSVLTARFLMPKDYICQRTLYKAISRPFCISAMNVPLERVHSWMCVSAGSDCRRDCRVVSSITCMATPCMVAVVASAGSIISCSKRDFSIDLNVETLCPSQVRLYMRKAWDKTRRYRGSGKPTRKQVQPTLRTGVHCLSCGFETARFR